MSATLIAGIVIAVMVGITGYLIAMLVYSIRKGKRGEGLKRTWANFGLGIALCVLFLVSWTGQAFAEWDHYRADQREHDQPVEVVAFINEFSQSTLENWQSEFLQLFSFVVLAAILLHRGSAESRDSDDRMERKIEEIQQQLRDLTKQT